MGGWARSLLAAAMLEASALAAAPADWRVYHDDRDVTAAAAPRLRGQNVVVNLTALAPMLGVRVVVQQGQATVWDSAGELWAGQDGDVYLQSGARRLSLAVPVAVESAAVYLPVEAVAQIAGLPVAVEEGSQIITFGGKRSAPEGPPGWQALTIEKTAEERAEDARLYGLGTRQRHGPAFDLAPPPGYSLYRLQVAPGYVQNADGGADLLGSGQIKGLQTDFNTFLTLGPRGLDVLSGRLSVADLESGWEAQGGDLFSDIWGLARGVRYARRLGARNRPAVSLYLQTRRDGTDRPLASLNDEFALTRYLALGGEVNSDRSYFAKTRLQTRRFSLYSYYRQAAPRDATAALARDDRNCVSEFDPVSLVPLPDQRNCLLRDQGNGHGFLASFEIARGITVQGRFSRQGYGEGRLDWRSASLRVPLVRRMDLTLEHTDILYIFRTQKVESATLSAPVGPVRMRFRYNYRLNKALPIRIPIAGFTWDQNEVISSISYFAGKRVNLDFQAASRWRRDGVLEQWEQLIGSYRVSDRTELQLISAFPNIVAPEQMRLRVTQRLRKDLAFIFEYGNIPSYQGFDLRRPGERVFRILLRKDFGLRAPTRGGHLDGAVVDSLGRPVPQAIVRLGPYSAATDERGRYRFDRVPSGPYQVRLDDRTLPADYMSDEAVYSFESRRGARGQVDFTVSSLDTIRGFVYVDENDNGKRDENEGLARVAVRLGERVTATAENGAFGFYNVKPGPYTVRLAAELLPREYEPASATEVEVTLAPGQAATGLEFRLKRRVREVIFQELDGN